MRCVQWTETEQSLSFCQNCLVLGFLGWKWSKLGALAFVFIAAGIYGAYFLLEVFGAE